MKLTKFTPSLRIAWREDNNFKKENWAKQKVLELQIPVPKTLQIGFLKNNGKTHQYSLETFVKGQIYSIYQTDRSILTPIFESAGSILGQTHSVPTTEYVSFVKEIQKDKLEKKLNFEQIAKKQNLVWRFVPSGNFN